MSYYLIINLGLRSIRVILFDKAAHIIERNWYPVQTVINGGRVEQDPNEWWVLCKRLLREMQEKNPSYLENLQSISVTSSASCLVVLDEKGNPLMNSLMVSDKRAAKEATILKKSGKLKKLFSKSNNLAVPAFMFPKMLWIRDNLPKIFKKAKYFLSSNDYLLYKLTGKLVTDSLNAEKFYFDQKKQIYPPEVLRYLKISKETLPSVASIGTSIGKLSDPIQKEFGFSDKTKVVLTSYDAICAFVGSGAVAEGDTNNVCGTVSSVRTFTRKVIKGRFGLLSQQCNDFKMVGGSNNIDGGLLEWSKGMFYGDTYPDKYVYTIMAEEAGESSVGSNGLLFLPYIVGERIPFSDSSTRGIFFGLERSHTRKDVMRSVFEASGFMVNDIIKHIEKLGVHVKNIRMSGGLSISHIACKIRADITGKTVYVCDDPETTSLGALFILLVEDGVFKNLKQTAKLVKFSHVYKPDMQSHRKYNELYTFFKKTYATNKKLMEERKILIDKNQLVSSKVLENL